jgi:hypothetical protein
MEGRTCGFALRGDTQVPPYKKCALTAKKYNSSTCPPQVITPGRRDYPRLFAVEPLPVGVRVLVPGDNAVIIAIQAAEQPFSL